MGATIGAEDRMLLRSRASYIPSLFPFGNSEQVDRWRKASSGPTRWSSDGRIFSGFFDSNGGAVMAPARATAACRAFQACMLLSQPVWAR